MDSSERDQKPSSPVAYFQPDGLYDSGSRRRLKRTASAIAMGSLDFSENEHNLMGFTRSFNRETQTSFIQMTAPLYANDNHEFIFQPPQVQKNCTEPEEERYPSTLQNESKEWMLENYTAKNEHLLRSGQVGVCSDPYCTTCPMYDTVKGQQRQSKSAEILDAKFHNMIYGDAKGWAKRMCTSPRVMNPHSLFVRRWNKFFLISCLLAVFLDPLFFFLLYVQQDNNCIVLDWPMTTTIVALRSMFDFIYLLHILLQFRLAYIAPESRVVGAGELVDDPKMIAKNYLFGYFFLDLFVVMPLPQIIILIILPDSMGGTGANYAKDLLRAVILIQYIPRLFRVLPLAAGSSPSGFTFESAWSNFVINLLTFVLASHVVGSCWYLFGLQRVNQCLREACQSSQIAGCLEFIDCGHGNDYGAFQNNPNWGLWQNSPNATACFGGGSFNFGIYQYTVSLTTYKSLVTRYIYSLFWGLLQISTLAGNQVPSYFVWEVLFTMSIIWIGLLLFALLIGNMQNFLQDLGRRRLEMSLRRRDVEQWMSHRRLPEDLRRQVREAERFNWAATRGVNEEMLMENLPEDLQRDIKRHLFKFVKKVRIFQLLDEPIVDAVCEVLRTKLYIKGSKILYRGGLIDKMLFIIRGKMESIGEDGIIVPLSEGDVCGEELLTWCLEHSSINRDGRRIMIPGHKLLSNRTVRCISNAEAFVLRGVDLLEVTSLFARFLRSPRVQGAIRYESPYWRGLAAQRIQVAWRYRKKRMGRGDSSSPPHNPLPRPSPTFKFLW